jgi:putative oxidoreductase
MANLTDRVAKLYRLWIRCLDLLQPVVLLVIRVYIGYLFFISGKNKLTNIESVAEYFASLHIPMPVFNAYLSGATECLGGLCLLLGLASRLITIPLLFNMVIAYLTAHADEAFLKAAAFPYLATVVIVLLFGPGLLSVDGVLGWYLKRSREDPCKTKIRIDATSIA